jgi:hypothetical protein
MIAWKFRKNRSFTAKSMPYLKRDQKSGPITQRKTGSNHPMNMGWFFIFLTSRKNGDEKPALHGCRIIALACSNYNLAIEACNRRRRCVDRGNYLNAAVSYPEMNLKLEA